MTFVELRTELSARGYAHLSTARLGQIINDAIVEFEETATWPFREDSAQGVGPLSIPTLGLVEAVSNETQGYPLEEIGYGDLADWGVDLSATGSPVYWYRSTPAGDPVVDTYPTSTDTIGVQFWATSTTLTLDADVPLTPERYHSVILLIAQRMAEDERGNAAAAAALQDRLDRRMTQLFESLLSQQSPRYVRMTGASCDD